MTPGNRLFHSTIYWILLGGMLYSFPLTTLQWVVVTVILSFIFTRLEEIRQSSVYSGDKTPAVEISCNY